MKIVKNERGLVIITFQDFFEETGILSESSKDAPHVWLGTKRDALHLNQEQVANLVKYLQHFVETGRLGVCAAFFKLNYQSWQLLRHYAKPLVTCR